MKLMIAALLLTLGALATPACSAPAKTLTIAAPGLAASGRLQVTSSAFAAGGSIPSIYSSYDKSVSPPLAWRGLPPGTASVAVVLEDPDAATPAPFNHWLVWNIPPAAPGLAKGSIPGGARQGKLAYVGTVGYMGPKPPAGPAHHYHFEVFALDRSLDLAEGSGLSDLTRAMLGHVLASGEIVATFQKP